jgi:ArsR family transcriptional regulator
MTKAERTSAMFTALSSPARVSIVHLLKDGELCAGRIARKLKVSPSAASQHLRVLRNARLVVANKKGAKVHYELNEQTLSGMARAASELLTPPVKKTPCRNCGKKTPARTGRKKR